jgi:hypothetical protein
MRGLGCFLVCAILALVAIAAVVVLTSAPAAPFIYELR